MVSTRHKIKNITNKKRYYPWRAGSPGRRLGQLSGTASGWLPVNLSADIGSPDWHLTHVLQLRLKFQFVLQLQIEPQ